MKSAEQSRPGNLRGAISAGHSPRGKNRQANRAGILDRTILCRAGLRRANVQSPGNASCSLKAHRWRPGPGAQTLGQETNLAQSTDADEGGDSRKYLFFNGKSVICRGDPRRVGGGSGDALGHTQRWRAVGDRAGDKTVIQMNAHHALLSFKPASAGLLKGRICTIVYADAREKCVKVESVDVSIARVLSDDKPLRESEKGENFIEKQGKSREFTWVM